MSEQMGDSDQVQVSGGDTNEERKEARSTPDTGPAEQDDLVEQDEEQLNVHLRADSPPSSRGSVSPGSSLQYISLEVTDTESPMFYG